MNVFSKLRANFDISWTTILVGWNGLGAFSPWPDRSDEFPPLLSADDLVTYANERVASSSGVAEDDLIAKLLSLDLRTESRETIRDVLTHLSNLCRGNPAFEIRKWRLILLEELLDNIPKDALYGLMALTEFWQSFGFPLDSPHEVQGRGNKVAPSEYYQEHNLYQLLARHRIWAQKEKIALSNEQRGQQPIQME
jgi:hypothetical protein